MRRFGCDMILNKILTKILKNPWWSLNDYHQGWAVHASRILENQNICMADKFCMIFGEKWASITSSKTSTLAWNLRSTCTTSNMPHCEAIISGEAPLWIKQTKNKHMHHTFYHMISQVFWVQQHTQKTYWSLLVTSFPTAVPLYMNVFKDGQLWQLCYFSSVRVSLSVS